MKETGIIMSGDHPTKILDGTKTMTRRARGLSLVNDPPQSMANWQKVSVFQDGSVRFATPDGNGDVTLVCPYGGVGDRLWVRESIEIDGYLDLYYKADNSPVLNDQPSDWSYRDPEWKGTIPSIHMSRWASRIERIITLLRVERLRDITEADAKAEGGYTGDLLDKVFESSPLDVGIFTTPI